MHSVMLKSPVLTTDNQQRNHFQLQGHYQCNALVDFEFLANSGMICLLDFRASNTLCLFSSIFIGVPVAADQCETDRRNYLQVLREIIH